MIVSHSRTKETSIPAPLFPKKFYKTHRILEVKRPFILFNVSVASFFKFGAKRLCRTTPSKSNIAGKANERAHSSINSPPATSNQQPATSSATTSN